MDIENSVQSCGCSGDCGDGANVSRRDFLKIGGFGSAALLLANRLSAAPGDVRSSINASSHLIPADKDLPAGWLRELSEKGAPTFWSGEELHTVGMPVGGIGTGQIYLCGDGTLGQWEIFNAYEFIGWGAKNYTRRTIPKPVKHGIALVLERDGEKSLRMLDRTGFSDVKFRGTYPIATVTYSDPESPVEVTLEGFSPFIPLNAADSALPATLMKIVVRNTGSGEINVSLVSWLENPVARTASDRGWKVLRSTELKSANGISSIRHSAAPAPEETDAPKRDTITFAEFEGDDYGDWKVEGKAFGPGPAAGNLEKQQNVTDFEGKKLANSFHEQDRLKGKLISPEFKIERRFINFLVGGGNDQNLLGMRLFVGGEEVRRAAGENIEKLKWQYWDVAEFDGKSAHLEIIDDSDGGWGHTMVDQIEFSDQRKDLHTKLEEFPDFGTLAWNVAADVLSAGDASIYSDLLKGELEYELTLEAANNGAQLKPAAMVTKSVGINAGDSHEVLFALTWHFPNTTQPSKDCGHEYAARFKDAAAVADYVFAEKDRLITDTRKWVDTYYDSSLPIWLLDRVMWPASCLATGTVQWWRDGRFWAWEGVVCCDGTCTHVWNYSQQLARLFPELERNVRERQDLGVGLVDSGLVGFRHNGAYAADGQCGTVLKVWREHLISPDNEFLRKAWPKVKKVIDFSISKDENEDGLIENAQHNTYDIDFHGANTFVGALYLGALRAAEEMAREMGETQYADRLHRIYESGRKLTEERLWNGEYFTQDVDLKKHPEHQYATGCLSDQMFGQNWAHQTGLGYIYDPAKVKSALQAVWKYNWAPDIGVYNKKFPPERPFAEPAEAGLFICTWPGSKHLDNGVRYKDEVWTGIEYQVASHMVYEGLIDEALAICRAVHDRYHPLKRNPYNEVECSDFYARAMAGWGMLLGLSGFEYNGPKGEMGFAPCLRPEEFRCVFTAAEGWGVFDQKLTDAAAAWKLDVRHGKLRLTQLRLPAGKAGGNVKVIAAGQDVTAKSSVKDGKLLITFTPGLVLEPGGILEVSSQAG